MSIGDQLAILDPHNQPLAYIEQKMFSFQPSYRVVRNGSVVLKIRRGFGQRRRRQLFNVESDETNAYAVDGDFWNHEYRFLRDGVVVAQVFQVSQSYYCTPGVYGIDIDDGEDDVSILATAVVIDLINDHNRRN